MAANDIKLQRTQKGEGEIRKKSHALTQSQRLILASVDGVSQIAELQRRLGGMAKRRFALAVADLTARGLVEEAKNPMAVPDKLDLRMVERFVRQDPSDPITITALYLQAPPRPVAKPAMSSKPSPEVDFFIQLTPNAKPAPAKWQPPEDAKLIMGNSGASETKGSSSRRRARRAQRSRQIQIGYWLLFAGLVLAVTGFVAWYHLR
ncbi:MAG: hypothetical protein JO002_04235 [Burkholderiaceae bacterium]|nr:hypothetical protein [Burkholderiaceae bacterium]